ncbi:MAG: DUF3540 domain-containing protein [Myxococcota bacterium]
MSDSNPILQGARVSLAHAEVVGPIEKQWCRARFGADLEDTDWVRLALPAPYAARVGDVLLVARSPEGSYAIGVLETAPATPSTESAASTYECHESGQTRLGVRDEQGDVLFEYDPDRRKATLSVPEGDLELRSGGNLDLVSGQEVRMVSAQGIAIESSREIDLRVGDAGARLRMANEATSLQGESLRVEAKRTELRSDAIEGRASSVELEFGRLRTVARRVERVADTVVETARSFQQRVEGLHQTTAGRLRQLVDGVAQLRAERLNVRGRRGVKLDGEKIHLG